MKIAMILSIAYFLAACTEQVPIQKWTSNTALLPDQQQFPFWEDQTNYQQVYFVDQSHPKASDSNPGTEESPFLSIGKAASIAECQTKIIVKKGIYRELVKPAKGGNDEKSMICYETYSDDEVVISGSEIVKENWTASLTPDLPHRLFSHKLWMAQISHSYFKSSNPFKEQNADENEMKIMSWAKDWTNKAPYTLVKGIFFQEGKRMTQLYAYEDLVKLPGSYWVDTISTENYSCTIHIHPFENKNPNTEKFEITTRETLFNPKEKRTNFIHVKGFIFEQVGNGFQRTGNGALSTYGGSHWIIEKNTFKKINSVAVEIGARTDEHFQEGSRKELETVSGKHIVRNNLIYDCGTGGIQGLINCENLIEENHLHNIGWQEAEFYYETAAIKILNAKNCLVRKNHIHDIEAASGIWVDYDNINTRICQNLIYNVNCNFGGIFIECSTRPNLVDNNLIWNCYKNGIYQHDCDSLIVVQNTIGYSYENGIMMKVNEGRRKPGVHDGVATTARYNKILYNVLFENGCPFSYNDTINQSDYNIIAISEDKNAFDLESWNKKGFDQNSRFMSIESIFNSSELSFTFRSQESFPCFEKLPFITEDLIGRDHIERKIIPGALKAIGKSTIDLGNYFNSTKGK